MKHHIIDLHDKKYEVIVEYNFYPDLWESLSKKKNNGDFDELVIDQKNNLILLCNEMEDAQIISETSCPSAC